MLQRRKESGQIVSQSQSILIRQLGSHGGRRPDDLATEEPLLIRVNGQDLTTTMRSPGHDSELAAGVCVTEGLLRGATVRRIIQETLGDGGEESSETGSLSAVNVVTDPPDVAPRPRLAMTSTACGLCGHSGLDDLIGELAPLEAAEWDDDLLLALPELGLTDLPLFTATGATHAAALVNRAGKRLVAREDVGRHNAVDKVIGYATLEGLWSGDTRPGDVALVVSGRASFEIVQKAWAGGIGAVVAVSAPTALAVTSARKAGMVLVGFAGRGHANLYSPSVADPPNSEA